MPKKLVMCPLNFEKINLALNMD